eukprot:COSAG06_NODE_59721_length_273_cov_0.597701_2_plen_38_part_01
MARTVAAAGGAVKAADCEGLCSREHIFFAENNKLISLM